MGMERRNGVSTGLLLAVAVGALALPSAVLAFSSSLDAVGTGRDEGIATISGPGGQARFAADMSVRTLGRGHPFRFTPAGIPTRPDRSVTVAVRVDPRLAGGITVRGGRPIAGQPGKAEIAALQIAPTAFSLGVARGYHGFAQNLGEIRDARNPELPDISAYTIGEPGGSQPSRLAPRISLDDRAPTGRAPRTFSGVGQDRVDVGGSLRLTRNLDVTAGVRYSQERERLPTLTDSKQDNQAVYVGTQFRF